MAKILHRGDCSDGFLRGEGKFEIYQSLSDLTQQLANIEHAGRTCYRSEIDGITPTTAGQFIGMLIKRGHESVIEHSCLTVKFTNVSRGFTHEMVRHRLCAFSQESTRYVDYAHGKLDLEEAELKFVMPPHRTDITMGYGYEALSEVCHGISPYDIVCIYESIYKKLRSEGWTPQDARQFLPIGICSSIVVTANFREWRHIMEMRTQRAAHWEIRYIMCDLLAELKKYIPIIFRDFYLSDKPDSNGYRYVMWSL